MVATDGSENAKKAFRLALIFFEEELFEQIIVSHITDKSKTYLPPHFLPQHIYDEYKAELLSRYPTEKYKLVFEEKRIDEPNCRDQLLHLAEAMQTSFIFIGFSGRKGEKLEVTVISQTVKHCAFHSTVPLVIVKTEPKRQEQKSGGYTYLACVDGSKKGWKSLSTALALSTHPTDKVLICYAPTPDKNNYGLTIKAAVEEQLEKVNNIPWEFVILPPTYDQGNSIAEFVNLNENYIINFVIVGNNGYRAQMEEKTFFGRTAEILLTRAKANLIIISS